MTDYRPEGRAGKDITFTRSMLQNALYDGNILEARAFLCDNEHNLHVDLGCMRGIIPKNECVIGIEDGSVRDIAIISRVNKPVCFKIAEIENTSVGTPVAILSRKAAQKECIENYISSLTPGDIIDATVTHLDPFGAFCDIGCGISALMPIDCISVSRIPHPSARLRVNENIRVIVKNADEPGRITLTQKELLGTWEENAGLFRIGETVPGTVRSIEDYGIFIELTPNLAGLAEVTEGIKAGQQASVFIKNIIPEKMKIKLTIVSSFDEECKTVPIKYFFSGDHIDRFEYSPECCEKKICTVFG